MNLNVTLILAEADGPVSNPFEQLRTYFRRELMESKVRIGIGHSQSAPPDWQRKPLEDLWVTLVSRKILQRLQLSLHPLKQGGLGLGM